MVRVSESKGFICEYGGCKRGSKPFTRRTDVERHYANVHSKEKPYQCPYCPHKTGQESNLENHINRHTGKKLKCPSCDFSAVSKPSIYKHRVKIHDYRQQQRDSNEEETVVPNLPESTIPLLPAASSQSLLQLQPHDHANDPANPNQFQYPLPSGAYTGNVYDVPVSASYPLHSDIAPEPLPYDEGFTAIATLSPGMQLPAEGTILGWYSDTNEGSFYAPPPPLINDPLPSRAEFGAVHTVLSQSTHAEHVMASHIHPAAAPAELDAFDAADNDISNVVPQADLDHYLAQFLAPYPNIYDTNYLANDGTTQFLDVTSAPAILPLEECRDWLNTMSF